VDVDTAVTTLDFSANFVVTSSPSGEANISLAGSGATIIVQEGDSTVDAAVGTLDFNATDFNVTSSPAGEANIAIADNYVLNTGDTMTGALEIDVTDASAFSVQTAGSATEYFRVDTNTPSAYLNNAADFRVYSDNGATVVYGIDGATGIVTFGLPGVGSVASIRSGTGSPESAVSAQVGSIFLRTDGGADTAVYRKESGTGNTGWVAIAAGSGGLAFADVQRLIAIGAPL
jgi:hypothetical protein